jgi:hypothetical protein
MADFVIVHERWTNKKFLINPNHIIRAGQGKEDAEGVILKFVDGYELPVVENFEELSRLLTKPQ